jgi:catechol 2,3-dioxygenase
MSGPQGPVEPAQRAARPIDPEVRVGHVHLRTADIDRIRDFYVGTMGCDVDQPFELDDLLASLPR